MQPLTLTTPKPLVSVGGVRMIDSIIAALHHNGIREIYVVVGYKKEQFAGLPRQYPGLTLLDNPDYDRANNISSLYYARAHLENAAILDADQLIRDPSILSPRFSRSGYCCRRVTGHTDEWLLTVDAQNTVTHCSRTGGSDGWELHSVSLWTAEDGRRLARQLEEEYIQHQNTQLYWDDVALFCHPADYDLTIRPMADDALTEIDSLAELAALDASYRPLLP
jgi:CTP:phosphocholine cytidylyltransferase-like protein